MRERLVKLKQRALWVVKATWSIILGLESDKVMLRAAALTYISVLSLVPALTVAFALLTAFGQDWLRRAVHEFVFANLAPGTAEQIGTYLDQFIANAKAGAMGGIGGLFLVFSTVSLLKNIEVSLNEIWRVNRPRPLLQRGMTYWAIITLGPIALALSLGITAWARAAVAHAMVPSKLLSVVPPLAITVVGLTFIYMVAPNTRVRLRSAFAGGLIAGIAWEIAKTAYAIYAQRTISYSSIYGSLGAIPLFLLWVYVSWVVVLFGAALAYVMQTSNDRGRGALSGVRAREILCAEVAALSARAYLENRAPPSEAHLSRELRVDPSAIAEAARLLVERGLLARCKGGRYVPARPPEKILLSELSDAAREKTASEKPLEPMAYKQGEGARALTIEEHFVEADVLAREALRQTTLADLARLARS